MNIKRFLKFLRPDVGQGNESNRERWLKEVLGAVPVNCRILDAGAGTQRYREFCRHLDYVSQDFGEYDGQGDDKGLQTGEFDYRELDIVCDITSIPEPDSSFDAIMCIEVLEHLPDPVLAISEFSRLLKPGGQLIMTAPFCSITHFSPYHFCTGFNKYWYEKHLTDSNFKITEMLPNGNYFEYIAQEVNRVPLVSSKYTKSSLVLLDYLGMYLVLRMLLRFSNLDSNSSELACYGYHVHCEKV
jgi:SAM-dependent methyltransferase